MAEFKCDSCQKIQKDSYKVRCSGECRRSFCMTCTGLDKATTKVLCQQKYHNVRFFCTVCDSPTLKYVHDRITQLQECQVQPEIIEALGFCLKKNIDIFPVITEMYDMLSDHDSKWKILLKKIDDISRISDTSQESLFKSINEIKQDTFNLSSILMDNHDGSVKVQVHDPSKEEMAKEMADLRQSVKQMSLTLEKLITRDKTCTNHNMQRKKSISTQTGPIDHQNSTAFIDSPKKIVSPEIVSSQPPKAAIREDWNYVVVSRIPPPYTANQLAHYVKEKLGTTDFIRCFPMLKNKDSSHSDFKIGVQKRCHLVQLKDINMWPPGTIIDSTSTQPSTSLNQASLTSSAEPAQNLKINIIENRKLPHLLDPPLATMPREVRTIKIGSDREAIAACKSLAMENPEIIVQGSTKRDGLVVMDPMTPPIVRLSQDSDAVNGRYVLARLRDPSILKSLRLFLAYLHDQPSSVCFEGHTSTSIKLMLASEGLPSDLDSLRKLYYRFHNAYGIGSTEVDADLSAFRSFFSAESLLRLQKIRESHGKYYSSGSPNKSKNF